MSALDKLLDCNATVTIGTTPFGKGHFNIIAGPCAIETPIQMQHCGRILRENHLTVMRGGLFKPRSSPDAFQGLGAAGIDLIREIKAEYGVSFVTEALSEQSLDTILPVADAIQIGTRNAQNYELLKAVGSCGKPVILKRGYAMTYAEWLSSAAYVASTGCRDIILCERGMRTVTEVTRYSLDVGAIAYGKQHLSIPVIADPSHPAGKRNLVLPLAYSSIAAGADGLLVEITDMPEACLCDGEQGLPHTDLATLTQKAPALHALIQS